jgi:circadian clock protein KaiC
MHLAVMHRVIQDFDPSTVILDPMTNLLQVASQREASAMLIRLIDFMKNRETTALFTSLTAGDSAAEATEVGVSSLMDTWLLLRNVENEGERNRGLYVLKSRGMAHSNQIREFILTDQGVKLVDVFTGAGPVLTGTARLNRDAAEAAEQAAARRELDELERKSMRRRAAIEAQIATLRAEIEDDEASLRMALAAADARRDADLAGRQLAGQNRGEDRGSTVKARQRKRNGSEESA